MGVLVRLARVPRVRVLVFAVLARVFMLMAVFVRMLVAVRHVPVLVFMRVRMRMIVRVPIRIDSSTSMLTNWARPVAPVVHFCALAQIAERSQNAFSMKGTVTA